MRSHVRGVVVLAALALALAGCSEDDGGTPAPTGTRQGIDPAGSAPPPATGTPSVAVSSAAPAKIGTAAELTADVTVDVTRTRQLTTQAVPGEVAGPAVAVDLTVKNGGGAAFDLGGLVVTATYGSADVPGDTSSSAPSQELGGTLAAGQARRGVYVFLIPKGAKASGLHLQVSSDRSPVVVQFDR